MTERLAHILERIDSCHLAKLWSFYRPFFSKDDLCLAFLYEVFSNEPIRNPASFHTTETTDMDNTGTLVDDSVFIPRRMVNTVERLVSAARDMDQIRRGKDIFKIVYLVTCVETLQKLKGSSEQKKGMLFNFFMCYTAEDDKRYVADHFVHNDEETKKGENSFEQFVGVLNEYRNCATHEGEYWNFCFMNSEDEYPRILSLNIDLEGYTPKNKKKHYFLSSLSYKDFEAVFIRTCIRFIEEYCKKK